MKSIFIAGTDTSCGKTYITCQLMQDFQAKGKTVRALKPVASGCDVVNGQLINEDVASILEFDKTNAKTADICGWLLKDPIAPHIAAKDEGVSLTAEDIANFCQRPELNAYDYTLIEGAGGLLVPLNAKETWVDVLKLLKIPVILVVGMRLGCINHALLTLSALRANGIECEAWVANCIDPDMLRLQDNLQSLEQRIDAPLLATVGYDGQLDNSHKAS